MRRVGSLKFGDVIIAVASFIVTFILVEFVLDIMLIPTYAHLGSDVAELVSYLISALIVGFVFAGKIREDSRLNSIGKVIISSAFAIIFLFMISRAAIGHWNAVTDDTLRIIYSTGSWTNNDWYTYEYMSLVIDTTLTAIYVFFGFVGLYLGSLRKPSIQGHTTEPE